MHYTDLHSPYPASHIVGSLSAILPSPFTTLLFYVFEDFIIFFTSFAYMHSVLYKN